MRMQPRWSVCGLAVLLFASLAATAAATAYRAAAPARWGFPRLEAIDEAPAVAGLPRAGRAPLPESWSQPAAAHSHVRLTADGLLAVRVNRIDPTSGAVQPAENVTVVLIREGSAAARAQTGMAGIAQLRGVAPGDCALAVSGEPGLWALSIHVRAADDTAADDILQVDAALVPKQDQPVLQQVVAAVRGHTGRLGSAESPMNRSSRFDTPSAHTGMSFASRPGEFERNTGTGTRARSAARSSLPVAAGEAARHVTAEFGGDTPLRNHVVALRPGGAVCGRVRRLSADEAAAPQAASVFFVRDGQLAARTDVSPEGTFEVRGLRPGMYSVIAAGEAGFAAFALQVVAAANDRTASSESPVLLHTVSAASHRGLLDWLNVCLVHPRDCQAVWECCQCCPAEPDGLACDQECVPAPYYYGGGGGGGGRHGSALGLLGLGFGIAGLATALANGDDNGGTKATNDNGNNNNNGNCGCGGSCGCGPGACGWGCRCGGGNCLKSPFDPHYASCRCRAGAQ